ncbi:hypothetical protein Tco_0771263 [Tanacetum coccineum]|uniref:Uncharacterized protein n=1 Tax=Tanacetum coccineum TaxID=301880 RepID=A0ABQ4ZHF9_9ASTR
MEVDISLAMGAVILTKMEREGVICELASNKAKMKKEIDAFETINIELKHSVATLLKENETLKKHYKDLYDSIKITRSKTIEQTTSLLANNADLKAQIQEKVFAIAALKNELRKLKGNSVDTKFAKTLILGKPVLKSLRNQSVVRQPNAFKSERPKISKPRFASQVDVEKDLSKPVTQHYLTKEKEYAFAKPNHMIASSLSRNSSKNMLGFSSNDMVYNHYLKEAKKKTQERNKNSKSSVMHTVSPQTTTKGSKPKPRSNNQTPRSLLVSKSSCVTITDVPKADHSKRSSSLSDSKHFVCSTCHKCIFNANHDACITKFLKEVNSRAKESYSTLARAKLTVNPHMVPIYDSYDVNDRVGMSIRSLFDEYLNGENQVVSKSSAVPTADASDKRQQQPDSTSSTSTLATTVTADENSDL